MQARNIVNISSLLLKAIFQQFIFKIYYWKGARIVEFGISYFKEDMNDQFIIDLAEATETTPNRAPFNHITLWLN